MPDPASPSPSPPDDGVEVDQQPQPETAPEDLGEAAATSAAVVDAGPPSDVAASASSGPGGVTQTPIASSEPSVEAPSQPSVEDSAGPAVDTPTDPAVTKPAVSAPVSPAAAEVPEPVRAPTDPVVAEAPAPAGAAAGPPSWPASGTPADQAIGAPAEPVTGEPGGVTDPPPASPTEGRSPAAGDDLSGRSQTDDGESDDELDDESADDDDEDDGGRNGAGGLLTKDVQISARLLLGVGGVIVLAALVLGAYLLGQRQGDKLVPEDATKTTGTTVFKVPVDYTTFVDNDTGVKLSFPKEWTQRSTADLPEKSLRLLAGIPNTADSVSVRVNAYASEITAANLADQKNVFDGVIGADDRKVLVNQTLDLRGLPALFYVYSFTDASTGQSGIHAHFFVFQGRKLVSMVFQAVPEARYALLAPVFDKIANSLEVAPGAPPAFLEPIGPAPATDPGASTTTAPGGAAGPTPAPSTPTSAPSNPTSAPPTTP